MDNSNNITTQEYNEPCLSRYENGRPIESENNEGFFNPEPKETRNPELESFLTERGYFFENIRAGKCWFGKYCHVLKWYNDSEGIYKVYLPNETVLGEIRTKEELIEIEKKAIDKYIEICNAKIKMLANEIADLEEVKKKDYGM